MLAIKTSQNRLRLFIKKFLNRFAEVQISMLSAQTSFFVVLAFFPFIVFVLTIIRSSRLDDNLFLRILYNFLPTAIFDLLQDIIENATISKNTFVSLSGIFATLFPVSRAINSLIIGINKIYIKHESRSFAKRMLLSLTLTVSLIFLILSTLVLLIFGQKIGNVLFKFLGAPDLYNIIWNLLRYTFSLLFILAVMILMYRTIPNKKMSLKEVLPGAIFSSFAWVGLSYAFSIFINRFFFFSNIYGSIGGIILLLLWLNWNIHVIFIGAEINALISEA